MESTAFTIRALFLTLFALAAQESQAEVELFATPASLSLFAPAKYKDGFTHFDYVNPNAPKGGEIRMGALGGFDNFNNFIDRGRLAAGMGLLYDSLMEASLDETNTHYASLAESLSLSEDRLTMKMTLRESARWHDGTPITPEDVIFSYETAIGERGPALYRQYYGDLVSVKKTGEREIVFQFRSADNTELPLIIGQLPIIPRHYWRDRDITKPLLEAPLGSGPYRIVDFDPQRHIVWERVPDYWGRNLPTKRGLYNFNRIRYEYFKDTNVIVEAVKSGDLDLRYENSAKNWATAYNIPAVQNGDLLREAFPHRRTQGMQGYVFNLRRAIFSDEKTREALNYAYDFEWSNRTLYYNQYTRTRSFFDNSDLAATGLPQGEELALLTPWRGKIPERVFTEIYTPPTTSGDGKDLRQNLSLASRLLEEAGWVIREGKRIHEQTGAELKFALMIYDPAQERSALPIARNMKRLGVDMQVRLVDIAQYIERLNNFDFDMVVFNFAQSDSPGNEQRGFWSSRAANTVGSRNISGIQNPAIDAIIEQLIRSPTRQGQIAHTRALDRILQWSFVVIPQFHIASDRYVFKNRFGMPRLIPPSGVVTNAWWIRGN